MNFEDFMRRFSQQSDEADRPDYAELTDSVALFGEQAEDFYACLDTMRDRYSDAAVATVHVFRWIHERYPQTVGRVLSLNIEEILTPTIEVYQKVSDLFDDWRDAGAVFTVVSENRQDELLQRMENYAAAGRDKMLEKYRLWALLSQIDKRVMVGDWALRSFQGQLIAVKNEV